MNSALRSLALAAVALSSLLAHPASASQVAGEAPVSQPASSAQAGLPQTPIAPETPIATFSSASTTALPSPLPLPVGVASQPDVDVDGTLEEDSPLPSVFVPATPQPLFPAAPVFTTPAPLPSNRNTLPALAPAASQSGSQSGLSYRVIVSASTAEAQARVRSIVPQAFRTTVNGQTVMQAGLFREPATAVQLQRSLSQQNLQASVIPVTGVAAQPPSTSLMYRVIVPASTAQVQQRVRSIVPGAFQTTVNGQTAMQVGLFREQATAVQLQQTLAQQNLQATVIPVSESAVTPPRSTPNERVVVMIDPGHGGSDPGAIGIGGIKEKDITLAISQQVATLLEQEGVQAILTRSDDRTLELANRVAMAERADANLFVSIHVNALSMSRPDVNGVETYYYNTGRALAQSIHSSVTQAVDMNDRGVRQARFYVLRNTSMPSVLVETGFITGRNDAAQLSNSGFRSRMAGAIARGIMQQVQSR
jgi:N-acetylmuramoyl-L-alanine amidase